MHKNRLSPVAPETFDAAQKAFFEPYLNADGSIHNVYGTLAHHLELAKAWSGFGLYIMRASLVDPALREAAIMRSAVNSDSEYEFFHHARIARKLGMDDAEIERIRSGDYPKDPKAALMVRCADDLSKLSKLSDAVWHDMMETFGNQYTLDVIFTIGAYTALAFALNSCGVEIEDRVAMP